MNEALITSNIITINENIEKILKELVKQSDYLEKIGHILDDINCSLPDNTK